MSSNVTDATIKYGVTSNGTVGNLTTTTIDPTDANTSKPAGLSANHIGIIVGVLVAVLLITAVVLFIIFRRRKSSSKNIKKAAGTSEVYNDTTAPLDEESKGMLKSGKAGSEQVELQPKSSAAEVENTTESSPLKQPPADANESQATLVNNDGNAIA